MAQLLIPGVVVAAGVLMMLVERAAPGRRWPEVGGWWARAALLNGVQAGSVFLAGAAWDGWLERHRPWSADALGTTGGALLGYLVSTFVYYWWHRARHASPLLWRWLHQLHHSPQRIEVVTSFYKHPLEIVTNSVLSSAICYLLVGLSREAASGTILLCGLAELVYHWNVRTPYWLGFVFQRPESHCVHHQEGLHAHNYGDLPLWDMLFGTFRNPRAWEARCGLGAEAEHRLGALLLGRDVSGRAARRPPPPACDAVATKLSHSEFASLTACDASRPNSRPPSSLTACDAIAMVPVTEEPSPPRRPREVAS